MAKISVSELLLFKGLDLVLVLDLVVAPCNCKQGSGGGTTGCCPRRLCLPLLQLGLVLEGP
jgi:hypothetical protein